MAKKNKFITLILAWNWYKKAPTPRPWPLIYLNAEIQGGVSLVILGFYTGQPDSMHTVAKKLTPIFYALAQEFKWFTHNGEGA